MAPKPQLILGWNGQSHELRPDLMRKSPPSKAELVREAERISHDAEWMRKQELYKYEHVPLELIKYAMDLMYNSNK